MTRSADAGARPIQVGLLGYGLAGSTFHAPVIKAVPGLTIAAVFTSRTADVARDLPQAEVVATPAQIFAHPRIELVVIATPNPTHFELAAQALRAGKHVVIDKPMTTTSADADALIALAAERGRLLSVYQNRRWDNDFLTVKALIEAGRLGRVYGYEAHFDRFRPAIKPGWRENPQPGSGILFDLGSHLIDQALALFGMPETVMADVFMQRPQAQVDDYIHLVLGYGNRRAILRAGTIVCEPGPRFALHGDAGSFLKYGMDGQEAALKAGLPVGAPDWGRDDPAAFGTLVTAAGERETIATVPGGYAAFYAGMAAAIAGEKPVPVPAIEARNVIAMIELARRSAEEGRTVSVERAPAPA
jgi:scyllo-inositol 2-dehydrogenase (NADP+)